MTNLDTKALEAALRVKPLEWHENIGHWVAGSIFGPYRVEPSGKSHWLPHPPASIQIGPLTYDRLTVDQAKDAAQADYAARILSALDLSAASPRSTILEEAARVRAAEITLALRDAGLLSRDGTFAQGSVRDFVAAIRSLSKETVSHE